MKNCYKTISSDIKCIILYKVHLRKQRHKLNIKWNKYQINCTFLDSINSVVVWVCSWDRRQFPVNIFNDLSLRIQETIIPVWWRTISHLIIGKSILSHGDHSSISHCVHSSIELGILLWNNDKLSYFWYFHNLNDHQDD